MVVRKVELPDTEPAVVVGPTDVSEIEAAAIAVDRATRPDPCLNRPPVPTSPEVQLLVVLGPEETPLSSTNEVGIPTPAWSGYPCFTLQVDPGQRQLFVAHEVGDTPATGALPVPEGYGVIVRPDIPQCLRYHLKDQLPCVYRSDAVSGFGPQRRVRTTDAGVPDNTPLASSKPSPSGRAPLRIFHRTGSVRCSDSRRCR